MAKKSRRMQFPKFLLLFLILGAAWGAYRFYPRQSADIFLITEPGLTYGDTTFSGILRKDAPVGEEGTYFLATPEGRAIMLDAQGLDDMIGLTVNVSGILSPAPTNADLPFMVVVSMETN